MPVRKMTLRSIDIRKLLKYGQKTPREIGIGVHIRPMEVNPIEKGASYILLDIVYSMKGGKREDIPLMDARLEIEVMYQNNEENLARMYQEWNKTHTILPEFYHEIGNSAFGYSALCMIPLTEKLGLPPVIPIPTPISPPAEKKE